MSMNGIFNQTNTTNFKFQIADNKLTEAFTLNIQNVNTPSVKIPVTQAVAQTQGLSTGDFPGSGFEFEPLSIEFLIDENMTSWVQMYKWMLSLNNYIDRNQSGWNDKDVQKPAILDILNSDKTDVILSFRFYGAWCSELSDINWDYTVDGLPAPTCTAVINFRTMEVEYNGSIIKGRVADVQSNSSVITKSPVVTLHPSLR